MRIPLTVLLTSLFTAGPVFSQVPDLTKDLQSVDRNLTYPPFLKR